MALQSRSKSVASEWAAQNLRCVEPNANGAWRTGHPWFVVLIVSDRANMLAAVSRVTVEAALSPVLSAHSARRAQRSRSVRRPASTLVGSRPRRSRISGSSTPSRARAKGRSMRIWYVEKGGTSASRNASCDLTAADDTRRFNTLASDECPQLSTAAREVGGGGLGLAPSVSWRSGHALLVCREGRRECPTQCLV